MRWLIDILALLVAVAMLAGLIWFHQRDDGQEAVVNQTLAARNRLELEIRYRSVTRTTELNPRGWPVTVDPNWFENDPPRNPLISAECPWVEVASLEQAGLQDPPMRMTLDGSLAGFWYNPYLGILRARVPVMLSDQEALELYNRLNATRLTSIFQSDHVLEDAATKALVNQQKKVEAEANSLDPTKPVESQPASAVTKPVKQTKNKAFSQAPTR